VLITAAELDRALDEREITAYYQPQFDVRTGDMTAVEALARWHHPVHGLISPTAFVPAAEEHGRIRDLGRYMLELACRQVHGWEEHGRSIPIAVNVSASELAGDEFCTDVLETLRQCSTQPASVTLEITETAAIVDESIINGCLAGARAAGLGIAVDDYGTGYSSLQRMYRLHATELKLDRHLVQGASDAELTYAIDAAHEIGARVVAEGIETRDHLRRSGRLGCDRAQGFYLAQPMPADRVQQLLAA
jgi:EAL domain-containing protein (putative c-di-GMP-specific phosphodiesterase class I)